MAKADLANQGEAYAEYLRTHPIVKSTIERGTNTFLTGCALTTFGLMVTFSPDVKAYSILIGVVTLIVGASLSLGGGFYAHFDQLIQRRRNRVSVRN